jgi:hypothetical protein
MQEEKKDEAKKQANEFKNPYNSRYLESVASINLKPTYKGIISPRYAGGMNDLNTRFNSNLG